MDSMPLAVIVVCHGLAGLEWPTHPTLFTLAMYLRWGGLFLIMFFELLQLYFCFWIGRCHEVDFWGRCCRGADVIYDAAAAGRWRLHQSGFLARTTHCPLVTPDAEVAAGLARRGSIVIA